MLEILETPITGLHVFAAVVLILIILIQPGKSGGLTAALGGAGSQQVFGGRGAGNFLTRGTWILASTFFVTSIVLAYISSSTDESIKDKKAQHKTAPADEEAKPAETPAPASSK
ncbi:MAG TPA: preprotein translocase subunit SecG [Polyangiaceae bacterium]|nr:preprotein translocase subunit SecG [Polyangiaceae bacterium]